jgi:hypothetical protein
MGDKKCNKCGAQLPPLLPLNKICVECLINNKK